MKTFSKFALVLGAALSLSMLSGCAIAVREPVVVAEPPVVVAGDPAPVVSVDWWYDGVNYYYVDPSTGLYFYYGVDGAVIWCARGWYPQSVWFHVGHPVYGPVFHGGHPVRGGWGGGFHGGHRR